VYEDLRDDLLNNGQIPIAEYEWATRPRGDYGIVQIDFEAPSDDGDNLKQARALQGSVDLYTHGNRPALWEAIEAILEDHCESAWYLNSQSVDSATRMLHREYVFETEAG